MKDLTIKLRLDTTQSDQASAKSTENAKKIEQAHAASVASQKRGIKEALNETQSAEKGKQAAIGQTAGKARDATGRFVAGNREVGDTGAAAWTKIGIGIDLATKGVHLGVAALNLYGQAAQDALARFKQLSQGFASSRDQLRELATIQGVAGDDKFTLRNAAFNTKARFNPEEGLQFRLQFGNSGQQFKGRNMSDAAYNDYEQQAAGLIAAKGFDPSTAGDLAGSLAGFKDRSKMGDKEASADALGKLNSGVSIIGAGKGRQSVLINQFSMAASAALNEDETLGNFQDSDEVAVAISLMAEKHDAAAAEMMRAATRGFRDFDGKAGDLLKKALVNSKTKWIDAVKQLAPVIEKEARDKGVKVDDVLKEHFEDILTRDAISVAINRGVSGGVIKAREDFSKTVQGSAIAQQTVADFGKSKTGMAREANAKVREAEAKRGAAGADIDTLRQQALAKLIDAREIDTTGANFNEYLDGKLGFGFLGTDKQSRIDAKVAAMLNVRSPNASIQQHGYLPVTAEGREASFNQQIGQITAAGGNPFQDFVRTQDRTNQLLEEQNKILAGQQPNKVAPAPVPGLQPALRGPAATPVRNP